MFGRPKRMSTETESRIATLDERTGNLDKRLVNLETAAAGWGDRVEKRISDYLRPIESAIQDMAKSLARIEGKQQRQDGERFGSRWIVSTAIAIGASLAGWFAHIDFGSK